MLISVLNLLRSDSLLLTALRLLAAVQSPQFDKHWCVRPIACSLCPVNCELIRLSKNLSLIDSN
jgi:hypothetical protein